MTTKTTIVCVLLICGAAAASLVFAQDTEAGDDADPAGVIELFDDAELDDDDETEVPITGTALEKASAAALAYTGGGRVTETEVGDEESYYEVEVTLEDGSQVDVQLDEDFNVVSSESDDEEEGDED